MKELSEKGMGQTEIMPLTMGFIGALISGILACNLMLKIVKKGKFSILPITVLLLEPSQFL